MQARKISVEISSSIFGSVLTLARLTGFSMTGVTDMMGLPVVDGSVILSLGVLKMELQQPPWDC